MRGFEPPSTVVPFPTHLKPELNGYSNPTAPFHDLIIPHDDHHVKHLVHPSGIEPPYRTLQARANPSQLKVQIFINNIKI